MYYLLGALALFFGEEQIKAWVEKRIGLKQKKPFFGNRIIITKHHNYGLAHNRRSHKPRQVLAVSFAGLFLVVINALPVFFSTLGHGLKAGMMLLLAGGLSNVHDRIKRKYVVDYFIINKGQLKGTIFNLADMMLFLGAALCAVGSLVVGFKDEAKGRDAR